ncbi:MAG TPA: aspartate--tRNA ligase [Bacteroidota bacterium]|nr:aspartate--tRNA ligase [Bacteroidota bacterium]
MPPFKQRTHTCGELRADDIGATTTLNGWVSTRRDLGGVIFIDLRDRYGKTQVVFNPQKSPEAHAKAKALRSEYVISVTGTVERRPEGTMNPDFATGEIDVLASELMILSEAETPPFPIDDAVEASEEIRLKYRYLDLRRPSLQRTLLLRHRMYQIAHEYFDKHGFLEIETPVLMRSTPEGARDYLVPSRVNRGKFYALPQSPQTYKQILMVSGFDRYVQIVKCFRDEDLRADRQPEFTQIDVEMSFIDEADVQAIAEGLMARYFKELKGVDLKLPLPRLTYKDAIEKYGSDKPDIRFDLAFTCVNDLVKSCPFKVFSEVVARGGVVSGFVVPGGGSFTRNQMDNLVDFAKSQGAGGLVYFRWTEKGLESAAEKFLGADLVRRIAERLGAHVGDLVLLVSDQWGKAYGILGALRLEIARRLNLIDESASAMLWVTEFPMFEYSEEEKRLVAMHHPFTSPKLDDAAQLETDPTKVRARAYDLVLNGNEIAGGSIRIHDSGIQKKVFSLLGIGAEEAANKFGYLLNAFKYGAPPHGGIAFGFDRMVMLMAGAKSLREVIAFPKTASAVSLMDEAPSAVDEKQLRELHIRVV